jgi:hypothetical protein
MKRLLLMLVLLLLSAQLAFAANSGFNLSRFEPPIPFDSSTTRDAYGYNWVDNDNSGPVPYNWIDITTIGTRINGLTDDNNIGPIPIGFNFPYYWYTVNRCWVGSNGYIEFDNNYNFAHPFADIPTATPPNNYLACLTGDLDFSRGNASCYYYSHADSFVVSWINVGEYGYIDSTHTFQLILNAADSSITYQYGVNHGRFLDSSDSTMTVIGIENVTGTVGLQYLRRNLPANHMWHSGLAIRFHPIPNPSYAVKDAGVVQAFNEGSQAIYIPTGSSITPRALFKNYGNRPDTNIVGRAQIRRGSTSLYNQVDTIEFLDPGLEQWIDFPGTFTCDTNRTIFKATWTSTMLRDAVPGNNSLTTQMLSYRLPQQLKYDDGLVDDGRSWTGDSSGFGQEFQIPEAVGITTGSFFVYSVTAPGAVWAWIFGDDGNGHPNLSTPLAGDTVQVSDTGWVNVDFTYANLNFQANQKFYFVALHALQNTIAFGMDNTVPLSNRGWEYTGGMAPDRNRSVSNIMFRLNAVQGQVSVDEGATPKSFSLSQNYPNPFNAQTNIRFSLVNASDVNISIYSITGQLVEKISGNYPAGNNVVTWNASDKASGVYFYRLNVNNKVETKKMLLLK